MRRRSARDGQRDHTEARILKAAATLFAARGYGATTIRAIAGEAGVSVGRVIAKGDKERLLVLIVEEQLRRVHDARVDRTAHPRDPEDAVGNLVRPFISIYAASPGLAREYAAILARGQTRSSVFDELAARLEAEFTEVVAAEGLSDPASAARILYLVFIGALYAASHGAVPFDGIEGELRRATRGLHQRAGKEECM